MELLKPLTDSTAPAIDTVHHKHVFKMTVLNKIAKTDSTIYDALLMYKNCDYSVNSFQFNDLVFDVCTEIVNHIITHTAPAMYSVLLDYSANLYDAYLSYTCDDKINKTSFFYYALYNTMYDALKVIIESTGNTDSTDSESTMQQSESTGNTDSTESTESTNCYMCITFGAVCTCNECTEHTRKVNAEMAQIAHELNTDSESTQSTDSTESTDYDNDDFVIHQYFNALCTCNECTGNTDSESTDSTDSTESENTMQHTDSTDSESTPTAPAIIDNTNKDYSFNHDGFKITVSHTTQSTIHEHVYMNNGNENKHLKSTYEYMKNQRKNAPYNATVKYNPITNAWCTTYTAPAMLSDYNTPVIHLAPTAPAIEIDYNAPVQYYQQYKINVAQHRQQSEQKRQQKRQQKQNSRYENNNVKTVYESMTKNRKHEKIREIQNRIMQNDIDAYYNTPATIEHE